MSYDYLEDLEQAIDNGKEFYICAGAQTSEWSLSDNLEALRKKAQRAADVRRLQVHIYRLVNRMDTVSDDSYICVRRILDPGPRGEPRFQWAIVDTREAAEMMRDVSQGPSPYFGAVVIETYYPDEGGQAKGSATPGTKAR